MKIQVIMKWREFLRNLCWAYSLVVTVSILDLGKLLIRNIHNMIINSARITFTSHTMIQNNKNVL